MKIARKAELIRLAQKKFQADESDVAGALGEQLARQCLQDILGQLHCAAKIFQSLRVPKLSGQGKYEIDLLLVSEVGVLVIEVKHWSGSLSKEKDGWIQVRGQSKKNLQDPIKLNQEKAESLRQWLAQRGITVPPSALYSMVVLTHPQVVLCPQLKQEPSLHTLASLAEIARVRCALPKRKFWQKKSSRLFDFRAALDSLTLLPTWDRVQLHGGKKRFGDVESLVLRGVPLSVTQRANFQSVRVFMFRNIFPGIFFKGRLRIRDWSGKSKVYPLDLEAKLIFRLAGQGQKEEIPWVHIESLHLGWKDQSYYNCVEIL